MKGGKGCREDGTKERGLGLGDGKRLLLKIESTAWDHSCNLRLWELESGNLLQIKGSMVYAMSFKLLGLLTETLLQKKRRFWA